MYGPALEVLLKTTLLLGVGLLAGVALKGASSSRRHFLYGLTVVATLAIAPITLAAPGWLTLAPPGWLSLELPIERPASRLVEGPAPPASVGSVADGSVADAPPVIPLAPFVHGSSVASWSDDTAAWRIVARVLAAGYLAGLALLLGLLARSLLLLQRLARDATPVGSDDWRRRVLVGLPGAGGRKAVRLAETTLCSTPFVWGWRTPSILVPTGSRSWPQTRLKGVLLHELAHVRQRDVILRVAAEVLCALQWVNPLTWMCARRLRAEGEAACDDAVLAAGIDPGVYAGELLGLGIERRWHLRAAGAMSGGSPLGKRIEAVLDTRRARSAITRHEKWGVALCMATCFAVLVAADWQEPTPAPPDDGTVPVHVRWASGSESGAAFLHGSIDLDDRSDRRTGEPGFFLMFHRDSDGGIRSAHAVRDASGAVRRGPLASAGFSARDGAGPAWVARDLSVVGHKLRALGDRVRWGGAPLSAFADDPAAPRVSGSVMTGLPATTEDGRRGSLVAGWQWGADRVGLLACGAPGSGPEASAARSLLRDVVDRGGDTADLAEGGCLVAFTWNADRAELRLFESYRSVGGSTRIRFSDGSRILPRERSVDWLLALLSSGTALLDL